MLDGFIYNRGELLSAHAAAVAAEPKKLTWNAVARQPGAGTANAARVLTKTWDALCAGTPSGIAAAPAPPQQAAP